MHSLYHNPTQKCSLIHRLVSKQGDSALARDYYDRACARMDRDEPDHPMLILQRREAARLLGIEVEDDGEAVAQHAGE